MTRKLEAIRRAVARLLRAIADEVDPGPELLPWRVPAHLAFLDFPYPTPDPPSALGKRSV